MISHKAIVVTLLLLLFCAMLPIVLVNGQVNKSIEENMINLATQTGNQIQNLITKVTSDEQAMAKIEKVGLSQQFESTLTLYQKEGLDKLAAAKEALADSNYDSAGDLALQALTTFKKVYISLNEILESADLTDHALIRNQEIMDAINRQLTKINALENLIDQNATEQISSLEAAKNNLLEAKNALSNGNYEQAQTLYQKAKESITQIYQYLKTQAQDSNIWRLDGYCEKLQQQVRERFQYGNQNGVDFTSSLQALGYQSQNQLMQELQNKVTNAQSQTDIENVIQECLALNQMVQNMDQALDQAISHQIGPNPFNEGNGPGGSGNGNSDSPGNSPINAGSGLSDTSYKPMP